MTFETPGTVFRPASVESIAHPFLDTSSYLGALLAARTPLEAPDLVPEDVRVLGQLGGEFDVIGRRAGGMGQVLICVARSGPRVPIALKSPAPELLTDPAAQRAFQRECSIALQLGFLPGILTVYGIRDVAGRRWIEMQAVLGDADGLVSLRDVIARGPLDALTAGFYFLRIVRTLAIARCEIQGLVHGDLKPENILLVDGFPQLTDFGLATTLQQFVKGDRLLASPEYRAPEAEPPNRADPGWDVFSLGVILYELLVGVRPGTAAAMPEGEATPREQRTASDEQRELQAALLDVAEACRRPDPGARPNLDELCQTMDQLAPGGNWPIPKSAWAGWLANTTYLGAVFTQLLLREQQASALLKIGDYAAVVDIVDRENPDERGWRMWLLRGTAHSLLGQEEAALTDFQRAGWAVGIPQDSEAQDAWCDIDLNTAASLKRLERYDEAIILLEHLIGYGNDQTRLTARANLAALYAQIDRLEEAGRILHEVIREGYEDSSALENLAVVSLKSGDPTAAVEALRRAIEAFPTNTRARLMLGYALLDELGQLDEAAAAFDGAIAIGSADRRAFDGRLICAVLLDDQPTFKKVLDLVAAQYGGRESDAAASAALIAAKELLEKSSREAPTSSVKRQTGPETRSDRDEDMVLHMTPRLSLGYDRFPSPDELEARDIVARHRVVQFVRAPEVRLNLTSNRVLIVRCPACEGACVTTRDEGQTLSCRHCGATVNVSCDPADAALQLEIDTKLQPDGPTRLSDHAVLIVLQPYDPEVDPHDRRVQVVMERHAVEPVSVDHPGIRELLLRWSQERQLRPGLAVIAGNWTYPPDWTGNAELTPPEIEAFRADLIEALGCPIDSFSSTYRIDSPLAFGPRDTLEDVEGRLAARAIDPRDAPLWTFLGMLTLFAGDPQAAERLISHALELDPDHANAWCELGAIQLILNRRHDALRSALRCVELDPNHTMGHVVLGSCWKALDEDERAADILQRAHMLGFVPAPPNPAVFDASESRIADAVFAAAFGDSAAYTAIDEWITGLEASSDTRDLAVALRRMVAREPGSALAVDLEGDHAAFFKRLMIYSPESAERWARLGNDPDSLNKVGLLHLKRGELEIAISDLEQATALFESAGRNLHAMFSRNNLANAHHEFGQLEEAAALLEQCVSFYNEVGAEVHEANSLINLGNVRRDQHRLEDALVQHERGVAIYESLDDEVKIGEALITLGITYRHLNRYDDAEAAYQRCLELQMHTGNRLGQAMVLQDMSVLALLKGDFAPAVELGERSANLFQAMHEGGRESQVLGHLARTNEACGAWSRAATCYGRLLTLASTTGADESDLRIHLTRARTRTAMESRAEEDFAAVASTIMAAGTVDETQKLASVTLEAVRESDEPSALEDWTERLTALFTSAGRPLQAARIHAEGGIHLRQSGQPHHAKAHLLKALATLNRADDAVDVARCLHSLGMTYRQLKQPDDACAVYQEAIDLLQAGGGPPAMVAPILAPILNSMALILIDLNRANEASPFLHQALAIANAGYPDLALQTQLNFVVLALSLDDVPVAREHWKATQQLANDISTSGYEDAIAAVGRDPRLYDGSSSPGPSTAMSNVGASLEARGDLDEGALFSLGLLLYKRGELGEAETLWRVAAEAGNREAMCNLGVLLKGRGEFVEAEDWWRRAAEAGNSWAMSALGGLLRERGELAEAEDWWQRAAEAGDSDAMCNLGVLLKERSEFVEAEDWWRRAAEAGNSWAVSALGRLLHEQGKLAEAEDWWQRAAEAGDSDAMYNLGVLLRERGKLAEAETWWRRGADAGDSDATYSLGGLLYQRGVPAEAETWWRRGAEAGDSNAMYSLGGLFEGRGELADAEDWWRRGAEAGNSWAMFSLGRLLHERGELDEAEAWWQRAAEAGDSDAMYNLGGLLYQQGELDEAETWWRRGADADDSNAMYSLGGLLQGRGKLAEAETWYRRAADAGQSDATLKLKMLLDLQAKSDGVET
jgi:tetratricopeptide (TPR) repeat protein